MLTKVVNPPCPKCGGKIYEGPRFLSLTTFDCPTVPQWYCIQCDYREDRETSGLIPTYVHYKTPENEVERLRSRVEELERILKGLTTNPHLDLGDLVYDIREREGEGWDGPAVAMWSNAVMAANVALKGCHAK